MNHIFDVLRRLLDPRPLSEPEHAAAHAIIGDLEHAVSAAIGAGPEVLSNALRAAGAIIDTEDQAAAPAPAPEQEPATS